MLDLVDILHLTLQFLPPVYEYMIKVQTPRHHYGSFVHQTIHSMVTEQNYHVFWQGLASPECSCTVSYAACFALLSGSNNVQFAQNHWSSAPSGFFVIVQLRDSNLGIC
jgi:hypothetical protein